MNGTKLHSRLPLKLEVEILYEDFATGLRAHLLLDRLRRRVHPEISLSEHLWRFDVLRWPDVLQAAVEDALHSDVLLLSAHGDTVLPRTLEAWVREWRVRKRRDATAVVLTLDARCRARAAGFEFVESVERLLGGSAASFFPFFCGPLLPSGLPSTHSTVRPRWLGGLSDERTRLAPEPPRPGR